MDTQVNLQKEEVIIFEQLKQFISEIIGSDYMEALNVTRESIFTKDLEMDSIEIVAFAEKVKGKYGGKIDFVGWLSGMDMDEIISLSLGRIVTFIVEALYSEKNELNS
jgi:acyl carrier protein